MNSEDLYRAIGQIDDDLILSANEEPARPGKLIHLRFLAAAACFCLLFGAAYLQFFRPTIIWNQGSSAIAAKSLVTESSTEQILDMNQIADYYELSLPEVLGSLSRTTTESPIYKDAQGNVTSDLNTIFYSNTDGTKSLTLTLSRVSFVIPPEPGTRFSRIHGASIALLEDTSTPGITTLSAQWEQSGTTIQLSSYGLEKKELIHVLKELIHN